MEKHTIRNQKNQNPTHVLTKNTERETHQSSCQKVVTLLQSAARKGMATCESVLIRELAHTQTPLK